MLSGCAPVPRVDTLRFLLTAISLAELLRICSVRLASGRIIGSLDRMRDA